jgi:hypothetical protein
VNFIGQQISAHEIALSVADAARPNAWPVAHAGLHLWKVAVGICSPSTILRDFQRPLPALIGIALTTWAWGNAQAGHVATS